MSILKRLFHKLNRSATRGTPTNADHCCWVDHAELEDEIYEYADRLLDDTQPQLYRLSELEERLDDE